jgi:hypothetical protein
MGKIAPDQPELARRVETGVFTAPAAGPWVPVGGGYAGTVDSFNVVVWGDFQALLEGEYSFDGGTTAVQAIFEYGDEFRIMSPGAWLLRQTEPGVLFRLRCLSINSGIVNWRISQ